MIYFIYHFTLSFRIYFFQPRLPWWPNIEIIYGKASELRSMFTDTLNKVMTQMSHSSHAPLRLTQVNLFLNFVYT